MGVVVVGTGYAPSGLLSRLAKRTRLILFRLSFLRIRMASIVMNAAEEVVPRLFDNPVEIVRSDWRSEVVRKYILNEGLAGPVLRSYDHYVDTVREMVNRLVVTLAEGNTITFSDAMLMYPQRVDIDQKQELLMPSFCRLHNYTYRGRLTSKAHWRGETVDVFWGYVPIMLGSSVCNTRSLDRTDLLTLGECPNDPFGYFIIDGLEKIIAIQERTLPNKILTYMNPDDQIVTEIKAVAQDGRKVRVGIMLMEREDHESSDGKRSTIKHNLLKAKIPFFGEDAELNIFVLFELLGELELLQAEEQQPEEEKQPEAEKPPNQFRDPRVCAALIVDWIGGADEAEIERNRSQVLDYLEPTMDIYASIGRDGAYGYIFNKLGLKDKGMFFIQATRDMILTRINNEVFANMVGDSVRLRIEMLAMMVARFIEVAVGQRGRKINPIETLGEFKLATLVNKGLDDRDDYSNKMLDAPGSMLGFLTSQALRKLQMELTTELIKRNQPNPLAGINNVIPRKIVTEGLNKAIKSGKWQLPGGMIQTKYSGVTRSLQRESIVGAIADIRSVNAPIPRESHNLAPRSLHLTYWGFICPTSTKEGADCLTLDTEITLVDGTTVPLGSLKGKPQDVISVNPRTLVPEASGIRDYFEYDAASKGKTVYKLTTITGRTVKATGEHPFLVDGEWKRVDELVAGVDKLTCARDIKGVSEMTETPYVDFVTETIATIVTIASEMVADFTTVSSNHSFIAQSIVVSNCGLSKTLTQGATLSTDRPRAPIDEFLQPYVQPARTELHTQAIMFGGRFKGYVDPDVFLPAFLEARRNGADDARMIAYDVSLGIDHDNIIQIMASEGRPIRPVLVVEGGEDEEVAIPGGGFIQQRRPQRLVIDAKGLRDADIDTLMVHGALEFIDPAEQRSALIALNPEDLNVPVRGPAPDAEATYGEQRDPNLTHYPLFTHCELDPTLIHSIEASVAPFANMEPGTRNTYNGNMAKHAVGVNHTGHHGHTYKDEEGRTVSRAGRFEGSKVLAYPQKPLVTTDTYGFYEADAMSVSVLERIEENLASDHVAAAVRSELAGRSPEEIDAAIDVLRGRIRSRVEQATSTNMFGATGQNAIVAIIAAAWNEEDSMMINRGFIDRGGFMTTVYKAETYEFSNPELERLGIPPDLVGDKLELFSAIDPLTNVARAGAVLLPGMAIVAKYEEENGKVRDTSIYLKGADTLTPTELAVRAPYDPLRSMIIAPLTVAQEAAAARGVRPQRDVRLATKAEYDAATLRNILPTSISNVPVMDEYYVGRNGAGKDFISYKYRITRRPQVGDKFASRFSQKGITGMIFSPEDMPFNDDGMTPDIIINPHAFPSRMTIGQLIESLTGKAGALLGTVLNGTTFREVNMEQLGRVLTSFGFTAAGTEHFTDGTTGEPLEAMIFSGPVYMQVLRHMVEDKKHGRARGAMHHLYHQPSEGRARGGGLRLGEPSRPSPTTKVGLVYEYVRDVSKQREHLRCATGA